MIGLLLALALIVAQQTDPAAADSGCRAQWLTTEPSSGTNVYTWTCPGNYDGYALVVPQGILVTIPHRFDIDPRYAWPCPPSYTIEACAASAIQGLPRI